MHPLPIPPLHSEVLLRNAPINVKPQDGGGATPGEFDIFREAKVKFPTPRKLINIKYQSLEKLYLCKSRAPFMFKIPTQGRVLYVNFPWVALSPPPILGLNNDRCKILGGDRDLNPYRISDQTIPFSDPIAPSIKIYTVSQTKPIKIYTF